MPGIQGGPQGPGALPEPPGRCGQNQESDEKECWAGQEGPGEENEKVEKSYEQNTPRKIGGSRA